MSLRVPHEYIEALRNSTIEQTLLGTLDISQAHEASEETLFIIWRDTTAKMMPSDERERFLALQPALQRTYLKPRGGLGFETFKEFFLRSGRKKAGILVN